MKKLVRSAVAIAIAVMAVSFTASAQIYVTVRPQAPVIVRSAPPSPAHVWIGEEWEERGGRYVYVGGHWAAPPRHGAIMGSRALETVRAPRRNMDQGPLEKVKKLNG